MLLGVVCELEGAVEGVCPRRPYDRSDPTVTVNAYWKWAWASLLRSCWPRFGSLVEKPKLQNAYNP